MPEEELGGKSDRKRERDSMHNHMLQGPIWNKKQGTHAAPTLTRGYGDPSARESRRESSSSPMMSPSVKSSTLSGTGRDTQSGDGSKLAAGSEVGKPFASESEGKGASPSLTGMEVTTGAGRHCRSTEQSVMREKQSQSPRRASCRGQAEHSLAKTTLYNSVTSQKTTMPIL